MDPAIGCNECFVGPARSTTDSGCTADVCATDPSCCDVGWDERCVDLADAICDDARCAGDLSFGGEGQVTLATTEGLGLSVESMTAADATPIQSIAWADVDGDDGDADVAVVTDCSVRIELNGGWSTTLAHVVWFEHAPVADCAALPPEQRWGGRRARWVDVDTDDDLDLVVAGRFGVLVVEQDSFGSFSIGDTVMPAARGAATDVVLVDLDNDYHRDAIVSITGVGTRVFRHAITGWTEDVTWTGPEATQMELCNLAGDAGRELVIVGDALAAYGLTATGVGAPTFAPVPSAGTLVTCLTSAGGADVVVTAGAGATPVRVFDGTGAQQWSSVGDLEPDVLIDARGVEAGRLAEGDASVVVSDGSADAGFHVLTMDAFPSFTYELVPDLVADNDTSVVELVPLARPPR